MTYSLPTPLLPFLLLLALCGLLAVGLSVAALRRANRVRLGWRLGAGLLAVAGLWLLAFPPSQPLRTSTAEAILLTEGYSSDTLRHLLQQLGPGTRFWRYATPTSSPDTPTLSNLAALRQRLPGLQRLHVLGQGLPAADLPALGDLQLTHHFASPKTHFRMATWARTTQVGKPWTVEGYLENTNAKSPVWVRLRAAGGLRDSVQLAAGSGAFRLQFVPKTEGRVVYELDGRSAKSALRVVPEPLPLEVLPTRPLRLLLLAATPSFEFRFLKDYLARQGHSVALRTGLSRGLTQTEFLNQPAAELGRLTPALLNRTDVVLTDGASLSALSAAEAGALQAALRNGRSGLILLADATAPLPRTLPARPDFTVDLQPAKAAQEPQELTWAGTTKPAKALVPATLRATPSLRTLVTNLRRQPVAAARRVGLSQVVVATVSETFPWVLQGAAATYAAYWSQLLSAAVPPTAPVATIVPADSWPRPHAPLVLRAAGLPLVPITISAAGEQPARVALRQDERVQEWAEGTYWPSVSGWHRATGQGASNWFYVFSPRNWQGPETYLRQQAAAQWMAQAQYRSRPTVAASTSSEPWSRWWGFGLFVLGAGLLWLEEKL